MGGKYSLENYIRRYDSKHWPFLTWEMSSEEIPKRSSSVSRFHHFLSLESHSNWFHLMSYLIVKDSPSSFTFPLAFALNCYFLHVNLHSCLHVSHDVIILHNPVSISHSVCKKCIRYEWGKVYTSEVLKATLCSVFAGICTSLTNSLSTLLLCTLHGLAHSQCINECWFYGYTMRGKILEG